jgi:hypothetical protein
MKDHWDAESICFLQDCFNIKENLLRQEAKKTIPFASRCLLQQKEVKKAAG